MRSWRSCAVTTPILVDSNVILDLATLDSVWAAWSATTVTSLVDKAVLVINPLIYAEISIRYSSVEELEAALPIEAFRRDILPYEAAFLAGKRFLEYRKRGGTRTSPMPDFYIGAHAAVRGYRLLTRDAARYRTYFPTVELIAP
jgi:predicted nucleic acid-binding protein